MKKDSLRKALYSILGVINSLIPKQDKIVIYSDNILIDNSEAMFRYLNDNTEYPIVCLADKTLDYKLRKNVCIKHPSILRATYELLTCRVMIDSFYHAIKIRPTKKQLFIQCWHGSPLKSLASNENEPDKTNDYYSYYFYASDLFKPHLLKSFGTANSKMLKMGNPRNDDLFLNNRNSIDPRSTNIFWMPTYRTGLGHKESTIDLPVLNKENLPELNQYLIEHNSFLYIKPHRHQVKSFKDVLGVLRTSNIIVISEDYLFEKNMTVYQFLSGMDALLTDYSSVYFDFLLLNRPIGFVIDDFEQYKAKRGFAFDDPLSLMPGHKIYTLDDMFKFINDLSNGNDVYVEERIRVNYKCNYYKDNSNCKRCAELINDFMK